jgi:hypothetical protein
MLARWSSRAAPILFLVLSSLWVAATIFPLFYSLLFRAKVVEVGFSIARLAGEFVGLSHQIHV